MNGNFVVGRVTTAVWTAMVIAQTTRIDLEINRVAAPRWVLPVGEG